MVDISNELNEAFEKNEREIKAYAVVKYGKPTTKDNIDNIGLRITSCSPQKADISNINSMVKKMDYSKPIYTDYTTLEVDRTRLNGNFILPEFDEEDSEYNYAGYISENLAEQNTVLQVYASVKDEQQQYLIEEPFSGITLFFKDNIPRYVGLQMVVDNETIVIDITDNEKEMVNIDFEENLLPNQSITITATNWERTDRRIRLQRIELGHTEIYENEEVIDIKVTEQVKKFCEETPENECVITLNNINNKFDILNPDGITKYLNENTEIIPYIGALKEDNTIEYVGMGKFYLESWNNYDYTTTLICKNMIKKIKDKDVPILQRNNIGISPFHMSIKNYLEDYLSEVCKIKNNIVLNGTQRAISTNTNSLPYSFIEYLQKIANAYLDIIYFDRNEILNIIPINKEIKKTIDNRMYIEEPKIEKIDKINTVIFTRKRYDSTADLTTYPYTNLSYTLSEPIEIYKLKYNTPTSIGNGWGRLIEDGRILKDNEGNIISSMCEFYLIFEGNIGDTFNYDVQIYSNKITEEERIYTNKLENEREISMKINNDYIYSNDTVKKSYQYFLDNATEYNIEFEFIGNPALEAGDVIKVQTKYNDMDIFIESIEHKYSGGLSCHIKGVDIKEAY